MHLHIHLGSGDGGGGGGGASARGGRTTQDEVVVEDVTGQSEPDVE